MAALITQADLEARYPPSIVARCFCDAGSNVAGPRLDMALLEASDQGRAILAKGWPGEAQIAALVDNDSAAKGAICALAMWLGVQGKPEWSGEGAPYANLRKDARQTLEDLARAALRSPGEAAAGANTNQRARISVPEPHFVYTPTRNRTNVGGF